MKVLVCGSRGWRDLEAVERTFGQLLYLTRDQAALPEIIHGGAHGADLLAARTARRRGLDVTEYAADWEKHGKRAGILRNLQMLDEQPDLVIAFWDGASKGTKHTIDEARRRGIPVEIVKSDNTVTITTETSQTEKL